MINGSCFTNLDDYQRVDWPTKFVALPRIGDKVEGTQGNMRPVLKIVSITYVHKPRTRPFPYVSDEPYVVLELGKCF